MATPEEEKDFENLIYDVGRRRRYMRRPKQAVDLLGHLMARKGYSQQESKEALIEAWKTVVGPKLNRQSQVGSVKRSILEVVVSSSTVHQQLIFQKQKLLKQLQQQWSNKLKDIRFKVGPVESNNESS